ncbi:hypothetical protein GBF35_24670 [Nonomuraea phyllanthi]|uniref:hypothetical protein n=1 Tax=Nonomuraea phyllanthi TaxID=2219224 RepID=UPI001293A6EB|nr:hypothetical protein [Nonomuraea phyllanthi]QFY09413.1 hypothetical protein GBF35_24670 [Nonomuraea phyllanthi]
MSLTNINAEIERQATAMATAAADLQLLLYRFHTTPHRRDECRDRTEQAGRNRRTHQRVRRVFGEQNWGDMDEDETPDWLKVLTDLEATATFRRAP